MNIAILLGALGFVFSLSVLVYGIHVAVVFQRFNDGIKDWAAQLDSQTQEAINRSARNILRELDEKISAQNEENVEPLNDNNNE